MRMMLWKEFRENFKWAVLALIGLTMAEFYGLTHRSNYSYDEESATLLRAAFLMATSFGCAVVGLVLALIQILPEQRRDQWAALLHRPAGRGTIFAGKAIAGVTLYLFATIIPLLICAWYAFTPGHFAAPVVPGMLKPGIADICAGLMFYFAALFFGLQRGSWFGLRSFGFLAAVSFWSYVDNDYGGIFRAVSLAALAFSVVLVFAGWGTMLSNGRRRDQPWLGRVAIVITAFYGICYLMFFVALLRGLLMPSADTLYYYGTEYIVTIDGKVLKQDSDKKGKMILTDLEGHPVTDERLTGPSSYNSQINFSSVASDIGNKHDLNADDFSDYGYRRNQSYVVRAGGTYDQRSEYWYYVPSLNIFTGYLPRTTERIGSIGGDGFHPGYGVAAPLPQIHSAESWQQPSFGQFGEAVYYNNFEERKLDVVFSQPGVPIYGTNPVIWNQNVQPETWGTVALPDKILVIDRHGALIATLPYHHDMDHWGRVILGVKPTKDRFFVRYMSNDDLTWEERRKLPSYLEEMDAKGTLLNSYTLPPIPEEVSTGTWWWYICRHFDTPAFSLWNAAYQKIGAMCGSKRLASQWGYLMRDHGGPFRYHLKEMVLTSLVLAVVTWFWARRSHFSNRKAAGWALFVLGFNLAGLLTFRLVEDWPVRVKCPSCGKKRPVEEKLCPHCKAPWPVPERSGTEIFEEKPVVLAASV